MAALAVPPRGRSPSPELSTVLSFGPDALQVLDSTPKTAQTSRGCGIAYPPAFSSSSSSYSIPFYNILWADVSADGLHLHIDYAHALRSQDLVVRTARFALACLSAPPAVQVPTWVDELMKRAYGVAMPRKRAWVLVNPFAGPGAADKIWDRQVRPVLEAARMPLDLVRTSHAGQAVELARNVDIDKYDVAIALSGDGLPHEMFNGLGQRSDARHALGRLPVCLVPCGSGNGMSINLNGTHRPALAALAIVKGVPTPLDLVSVTHGPSRTLSFLSQAFGIMADVDITTEHLRWMGHHRFTYGFLSLVFQGKVYPCDITAKVELDTKDSIKKHYRAHVAEPASEDAGDKPTSIATQSKSTLAEDDGSGLPPLKYGTVSDKVPQDWELIPSEKLGILYCGNMPFMGPGMNFFPASVARDGLLDMLTIRGDVGAWKAISLQLSVESGRYFDSPLIDYRKVSAYRVVPRKQGVNGVISIDGESIPNEPFQCEIHPALGLTLSRGGVFEAPSDWASDSQPTKGRV